MEAAAILDLFGWTMGPPTKPHSWCVPPVKILSWSAKYTFQVIRIWIFSHSGLKVLFAPPKSQFLGILPRPPQKKNRDTSFRPPKRYFLKRNDAFWALIGPDLTNSSCGPLAKKTKKKKRQWQTDYSPRPPTSSYRSQSLHAGWPSVCSSIFQVSLKSVQWFCRCGWSKIALPQDVFGWLTYVWAFVYCRYVGYSLMATHCTHSAKTRYYY